MKKRILAFLIAFVLVLCSITANNSLYVSASNSANDLVSIAKGELGNGYSKYTKYVGAIDGSYNYAWCAAFVSWCGNQAGVSCIGKTASCYQQYNYMTSHGGTVVDSPQAGDIVFFYCSKCSGLANNWCHIGIMINSQTSIDGNYTINGVAQVAYDNSYSHYGSLGTKHSDGIRKIYVRPNYGSGAALLPGTVDSTWNVPAYVKASHKIQTYDAWCNAESGHYIDPGDNCYVEAVYTNGFARVRYPISSGDRWAYAKAGDFELSKKVTDKVNLRVWFSDTKMGNATTEFMAGQWMYLCYELTYASTGARIGNNNGVAYSVIQKIYDTDEQVVSNCTYDNDNNWIAFKPDKAGRYAGGVSALGGLSVEQSVYVNVNYDVTVKSDPESLHLTLNSNDSAVIRFVGEGACPGSKYYIVDWDKSALEAGWVDWEGDVRPLNVKALKTGTYKLQVGYVDGYTNNVLKTIYVDVTVDCSHKWGDWILMSEATCTTDGSEKRTCATCGAEESRTIAKTGHNYTTAVVAPTCDSSGYTMHRCKTCGYSYKDAYKDAIGHTFDAWTVTKAVTCVSDGVRSRRCSTCGKCETETMKSTGHSYVAKVVKPTCTEIGYTLHTCSGCGISYKDAYTDKTDHSYSGWLMTKADTCTEAGEETRYCTNCYTKETRAIEPKGHRYSSEWTVDKEPTCTEEGVKSHHCVVCGSQTKKTAIAKTAHIYDEGTVVKEPTTTAEGLNIFICINCGNTKTEKIAKLPSKKNGLLKASDGKYYYYKDGKIQKNYTGFVRKGSSQFYVKNGVWKTNVNGMIRHSNGYYYYVRTGIIRTNFTGFMLKSGKRYYFNKGIWRSKYTGIVTVSGKRYYVVKGIRYTGTGTVKVGRKTYKVVNGLVR